jgi:hypothetical protein
MPLSAKIDDSRLYRQAFIPGPGAYEVRKQEYKDGVGKTILGKYNELSLDNGVPGPGAYNGKPFYPLPGFKIVARQEKDEDLLNKSTAEPVGPQKYNVNIPAHTSIGMIFGKGTRSGKVIEDDE